MPAGNKNAQRWGDVFVQNVIFVQRLQAGVVSGTGRGFEIAPLKKHKRSM
jgi:hypothetical protein